jgi:Spy/CpxP family protein refolding chaperone
VNRPTRSILFLLPFVAVAAAINCAVALACTLWSPDRAPHDADHQTLAADMGLPPHWDGMMFPTAMDSVGLHV